MSVSRTSFASPPVQGTIDVTFNGVTKSGNTLIFIFHSLYYISEITNIAYSDYEYD